MQKKKYTQKKDTSPKKSKSKPKPQKQSNQKKPKKIETISGTLRLHPRGFGFVVPDDPKECAQDIFIPKHLTFFSIDGDHVSVAINPLSQSEKGPEGEIIAILKRGRSLLAGTVRSLDSQGFALVYAPLLGADRPVVVHPDAKTPLKLGDRIIMKILTWGDDREETIAELSRRLGSISDASCDITAAIEEYELRDAFPKAVVSEAKAFGKEVSAQECKGRKNLTKSECFTIDPETAKDFDDALTIKKDRKGHFHLGVHIADVAHYVKPGSALDREAIERCNSTYFPGTCLPMLPEELSNQLCSLRPDVIRLTVSVLMEFDANGTLVDYEVARSYIKSAKRFSYEEAKQVLDGKLESPHKKSLELMVALCHLLKKKRYERGSIDFSLPELVILVDKKGVPTGTKWVEYDITHQLVEEYMLKANELVAKHLESLGKPLLFRTHEEPSKDNMQDFFAFARSLGFALPQAPTPQDIQKLFESAHKTAFSYQLSVNFIRSMRLATYSPDNVGHFGLALEHYCHFTSPIRRYTDLIIQRLLFDEAVDTEKLGEIANRCSEQERVSFRAETSVKLLKKLRLLKEYFADDPGRIYNATVTRIKPFGLYFDMKELMVEGFLHISELEDDYFTFDPERKRLVGKHRGLIHQTGSNIQVKLQSVDLIHLETAWELLAKRTQGPRKRSR